MGVISGLAGSAAGGAWGASGASGSSHASGASGSSHASGSSGAAGNTDPDLRGGAGPSASGSLAGAGGATGLALGGTAGESSSMAGTGGQASGIPPAWAHVTDVDYSIVPGPNFDTVRLMFEAAQCSGSNCHYGGRNHFQMGKAADQLYSYMMSFKTLYCGKLIDTANPAQSALVKYLRGPCGDLGRMPLDKCVDDGDELCVPEYYIQAVEQWIAKGAPR